MKKIKPLFWLLKATITVFLFSGFQLNNNTKAQVYKADVIIYGGTSAAVIAAVQVKKNGKKRHRCFT